METFIFNAIERQKVGKGAARATRRQNLIPATVYGDGKSATSVALNPKELHSQLGKTRLYSNIYKIKVNNTDQDVLVRKVQFDAVTDQPIHVDLLRIGAKTVTRIEVPIMFHNQAKSAGIKLGGILNIVIHTLEISANPKVAPKQIDVDLSEARIGSVIKIEDIELPANVKTYYPKGFAIASITANAEEVATTTKVEATPKAKVEKPQAKK